MKITEKSTEGDEKDKVGSEWFSEWFDSPYYHILYQNRDIQEAEKLIDNLTAYCNFNGDDFIADFACGKGRHAIYLNKKGLKVTGIDLSPGNIKYAAQFSNERLSFVVGDMRNFPGEGQYNYILNLFTSFGYFNEEEDNIKTLRSFKRLVKPGGKIIIDFLNTAQVTNNLIPEELRVIEGIEFYIKRFLSGGFIVKEIKVKDHADESHFTEKVETIYYDDFVSYFDKTGLKIIDVFGDYSLQSAYSPATSERMIFILENTLTSCI
jgi:SAM-dependent methyltransferase